MSLIPCTACQQRVSEKLAQVTWAWNRADGVRVAYRQRLCLACVASLLLPLDKDHPLTEPLTCASCGIVVENDCDPVYATSFFPGAGKVSYEIPLCGPCAVDVRVRAQENAQFLPDRVSSVEGQALNTADPRNVWAELGVRFRG